jgi:hypothetical protein
MSLMGGWGTSDGGSNTSSIELLGHAVVVGKGVVRGGVVRGGVVGAGLLANL